MRLQDKVALITGGGSGIGRACAALFAREGARVVIADQDEAYLGEATRQLESESADFTVVVGDVSAASDVERMVEATVQAYGRLDVLVNSAGITSRQLPDTASAEEVWDRVVDVNLKGTYLACWYAVPEMRRSGGGSIVNLASIMGLVGYPVGRGGGFNPYPASKGGVLQLTRNLAIDGAADGIRVNCICPGYVESNLTRVLTEDAAMRQGIEARHPMGRFARPEEIANAALFLASDESSFVTGAPLIVDGGYTAQ
jgi:NAD(P)-dependent dehydrogenase (short-subunit alcohol dehydrogenase family)